jgi:hypothetical protein
VAAFSSFIILPSAFEMSLVTSAPTTKRGILNRMPHKVVTIKLNAGSV